MKVIPYLYLCTEWKDKFGPVGIIFFLQTSRNINYMSIELGKFNTLKVVKEVDFGMYLDGGEEGEILLPSRYVPEDCKPGDELNGVYLSGQ